MPAPVTAPDPAPVERRTSQELLVVHATLMALGAGALLGAGRLAVLGLAAVWAVTALRSARSVDTPGTGYLRGLFPAATTTVAAAAIGSTVGVGADRAVVTALVMVAVATVSLLITRAVRGRTPIRAVAVGDAASFAGLTERWGARPRIEIVGLCLVDEGHVVELPQAPEGCAVAVGIDTVGVLVDETAADTVLVVAPCATTSTTLRRIAWQVESRGAGLTLLGPLDAVAPHRIDVTRFAGATLVHLAPSRPRALVRAAKHALDRFLGAVLLLLVSPVLVALAVAIRLDSKGGPLFRQTRVGHHGEPFTMFKLRTMHAGAEARRAELADDNESDGHLFKIREDPRITRLGRFLRRSSLDELPQLINVVLGDMSLIGPRPALPDEVAQYDDLTVRRLAVRPGITGLWQVSGRSDLPAAEAVQLDLHYTDNWRLRDDAVIAARTARAVLSSRGAY